MKYIKILILYTFIILMFNIHVYAETETLHGEYTASNITLKSYSKHWNSEQLQQLYIELLNNFHGNEIEYLSSIIIFPDSPEGVNGSYFDDTSFVNGNYVYGKNSHIELYNGDKLNTIKKIAPFLSHEYGHHYTMFNILQHEGKYYSEWSETEYAKIRNLKNFPVEYSYSPESYNYTWDVSEIAANDYVQLLGSTTAKLSFDYKDVVELYNENLETPYYAETPFNVIPQSNTFVPLASEVNGLYKYMTKISGFNMKENKLKKKSEIKSIEKEETEAGEQYKIEWTPSEGTGSFEYTVIMYPEDTPFMPYPLKTVSAGEELKAYFGSCAIKDEHGKLKVVPDYYEGTYIFKIFIKDNNGIIHSSEPYNYKFSEINSNQESFDSIEDISEITTNKADINFNESNSATEKKQPKEKNKYYLFPDRTNTIADASSRALKLIKENKLRYINHIYKQKNKMMPLIPLKRIKF